jgi:SIR2-like domain/TIR domain
MDHQDSGNTPRRGPITHFVVQVVAPRGTAHRALLCARNECRVGSTLRVFISYRRSDAPSASRQLAEALKLRFGTEAVFLDTRDVAAGTEWRRDAVRRVQEAEVVLVVIGPHWAAAAEARAHRAVLDPALEDVVRLEIETAFAHDRIVIPVLVDDAEMPRRESLPRPFRPLADVQAQVVHHASWDRDVEALGDALAHLAARPRSWDSPAVAPAGQPGRSRRTDAERVVSYLADGSVVTVLGSGVHAVDRDGPWLHGAGTLPDTAELARHLAGHFRVGTETDDLARVSQHVALTEGRVDLYRALRDLLVKTNCEPSSAHRFIARLPGRLRDLGRERYQLVVTTNYDSALERAFDAAHEPYDLVVFVATGEHRGRFVHVPWWDPGGDGPRPITVPNEYVDLPMDEDGALERTVIVKLHGGGVDLGSGGPHLRDNFVITEDDYIGYLTQSPVSSLIPLQVLNKIRDSHFLFMGYRMRDWTLRVFLQRIWGEQQVEARSWAVEEPGLDVLERELWDHIGVHVVEATAGEFLTGLERELGRLAGTGAER